MSESSPAACRFAIRDRTAFCFLLTGLLNIDSALTLMSFAGRNDADGFYFAIFILRARYVQPGAPPPLRLQWRATSVRQSRCDPCGGLREDHRKRVPHSRKRFHRASVG